MGCQRSTQVGLLQGEYCIRCAIALAPIFGNHSNFILPLPCGNLREVLSLHWASIFSFVTCKKYSYTSWLMILKWHNAWRVHSCCNVKSFILLALKAQASKLFSRYRVNICTFLSCNLFIKRTVIFHDIMQSTLLKLKEYVEWEKITCRTEI